MKLQRLTAKNYRSLRDVEITLGDLNLFIGANASGKSTILDALRFLHEGIQARDFRVPLYARGGVIHLAWKGDEANEIELAARLQDNDRSYEWSLRIVKDNYDAYVVERVFERRQDSPPVLLLDAKQGEGWWWSRNEDEKVHFQQSPSVCALAAAAADTSFPARNIVKFIGRWGFFDPNPFLLRRDWTGLDPGRLDHYGRNLGETLHGLPQHTLDKIVEATQAIIGLPTAIETRESEIRSYFLQQEPGLQFRVHQMGVSSGTLRVLALMTALIAETNANVIGIEEPENYIHPTALRALVEYFNSVLDRMQLMITTHSPFLLDLIGNPAAVRVVQHRESGETDVLEQSNVADVEQALAESGFGLGEFYETKGFGAV